MSKVLVDVLFRVYHSIVFRAEVNMDGAGTGQIDTTINHIHLFSKSVARPYHRYCSDIPLSLSSF